MILLALSTRLIPVLRGGGLTGILGYDDGVYFGAAASLVHGVLPYRDFLLLHPPGNLVVLAPFAMLGDAIGDAGAFGLARLAFMVIGAVNAGLVAVIAGRYSRAAGLVAGLLYAVWSPAVFGERSTDLHPVQTTLVLLALLVLARPGRVRPTRAAVAGAAIGLATSIQLWQAVSVAVLVWWVLVRAPSDDRFLRRLVSPVVLGGAACAAFTVVCLPFLLADPGAMVRYVLIDQAGRAMMEVSALVRLAAMVGLPATTAYPGGVPLSIAAIGAAGALGGWTAWRVVWTRPWAALGCANACTLVAMPTFFGDYISLTAPAIALLAGTGVIAVGLRLGATPRRRFLVAGVVVISLGLLAARSTVHAVGRPLPGELVSDARIQGCVASDSPTVLIVTGALRHNRAANCPVVIDPGGFAHHLDRGRPVIRNRVAARLGAPGFQEAMRSWLGGSEVWLDLYTWSALTRETRAVVEAAMPYRHEHGFVTVRSANPVPKEDEGEGCALPPDRLVPLRLGERLCYPPAATAQAV